MRIITADLICPVSTEPLGHGAVVMGDDGKVMDVLPSDSPLLPTGAEVERHSGMLIPGFINAHCHLELSHMKGAVPTGTGLPGFLGRIAKGRDTGLDAIAEAAQKADDEMWRNGIQAVGDICNTSDTVPVKYNSRMRYHSFAEVIGVSDAAADAAFFRGRLVAESHEAEGLDATVSPHAPYSVSPTLFRLIAERAAEQGGTITLHSEETPSEREMFEHGTGPLMDALTVLGVPMGAFKPAGTGSLRAILPRLAGCERLLLVHNSCTSAEDMRWAISQHASIYWCACPSANLYIEGRMPDVAAWAAMGARVCIGTDSLASNHGLSILAEARLIAGRNPSISFHSLLRMATLNGAEALGYDSWAGSLERGKRPGLLLLSGIDPDNPVIGSSATVTRLA